MVPLSCALAAKWMGVRQSVTVDNSKGAGDAAMQQPSIALRARRRDRVLRETDLAAHVPSPNPLARGQSALIKFTVPADLPADRYQSTMPTIP